MHRSRNESGFTLVELIVVVAILAVLIALAVPAFLSFTSSAEAAGGKSNVRSSITAAEKMGFTNGDFSGISGATLRSATPGIGAHVKAVAVNSSKGYCIEDSENNGTNTYYYVGGNPGSALQSGYSASSIQPGTCLAAVGSAAS